MDDREWLVLSRDGTRVFASPKRLRMEVQDRPGLEIVLWEAADALDQLKETDGDGPELATRV